MPFPVKGINFSVYYYMALTDRQYYQIYRSPKEDLVTLITESSGAISRVARNTTGLTGDRILIEAPGAGKQIILLSATASTSCSLGVAAAGTNSFTYVATSSGLSWPGGLAVGDNNYVSINGGDGNYVALTYTIVDV
jgi:hypothetical protein